MTIMIMTTIMMMPIIRTEGEALAKEWGEDVLFFETSAKADIAVKEVRPVIMAVGDHVGIVGKKCEPWDPVPALFFEPKEKY